MQITIKEIPTFDAVRKKFSKIPPNIKKGASVALKKAAFLVEGASKKLTPVDSGRLRASIFSTIKPMMATVEPKTDYAIYVHEGTSRMKKRPYMTDGLEDVQEQIIDLFEDQVKVAIKKALR